ncbi:MAG: DNA primase, partial [bacterium]|nr:DNA primase [bacterium]
MKISEIKAHLSIKTVLSHYNLSADRNGMLNCPFHADKTPSMKVYTETNSWTCFSGNCSAGSGDVIEFIQLKEKITKHQAIMKAKTLINGNGSVPKQKEKPATLINYSELFETFRKAIYRSPKAKEYAEKRNLDINKLEIGYNSGNSYNKMKSCLIFPLKNKAGRIVDIYGRRVWDNDTNGRPLGKHFYTKERTGLYPEYPKEETEKLILTESVIDCASLLQYKPVDFELLTAYGTNGLSEEHLKAIKGLKHLKEIVFFFDGDDAGIKAMIKYEEVLKKLRPEMTLSTVITPDNEDINSLLQGHEPEIFTHLLNDRIPILKKTEKEVFKKQIIHLKEEINEKPKENKQINESTNHQINNINTKNPDYITYTVNDIKITVLGGINMQQLDRLRITLKIQSERNSVRNNIDLYNIDQTDRFIQKAADKLETGTSILNKVISELTDKLEEYRLNKLEAQKVRKPGKRKMTPERINKAVKYLKQKDLLKRTNIDIGKTGIVGEEINRMLMYLVFTSRLREQPLHIISLGGSGTGKTYLQEKIAELIPENDKKEITILSENAFYYFDKTELKNKLVLIEDLDGAEAVLYPLRELQSKKRISKTVPIKDSKGNLKTVTLNVEGPICLAGTTTRERLYEDNANRSILIYLDNSKQHKELIMNYQRKLSAGNIQTKKEEEIKEFFKDIQSVLKPVKVRNPYAEQLKIPDYVFKPLRTNSHYLAFIQTITFYHQYQRTLRTNPETGEKYILTEIEDIEEANKLIKDVLLAKSDELPRQIREFFESLKKQLKKEKKPNFYSK